MVAQHLSPEVLLRLGEDADRQVRQTVAAHPNTPAQALKRLAGDRAWQVAYAVAQRVDLDHDIVDALCGSPLETTRDLLASRTDLPAHHLAATTLATDPSRRVRRNLAAHTSHTTALTILANDPEPPIRRAAHRPPRPA